MASKLGTVANKIIKTLGKSADDINYSEVKNIIKGRGLVNSSVDDAAKVVNEVIENRKGIASAFEKGVTIGEKGNELIVPKGGRAHKTYNRSIHNKNASPAEAIEKIKSNNVIRTQEAQRAAEATSSELEKKKNAIVKKSRERSASFDKKKIQAEIEMNYADQGLADQIANRIEERGGFVGEGPRPLAPPKKNNVPQGPNFSELKSNRYDSKDAYMKFKEGAKYEEAMKSFNKKDFENPLLRELGVDSNTSLEEFRSIRNNAINSASAADMGLTDMMGFHRVPQKAVGIGGTAWLVNKLAASNGQQPNSQLYGQQGYY